MCVIHVYICVTFGNRGEGTMCTIYEVAGPKMDIINVQGTSHQVDSNFEELNLCSILDWGNACGCDFDRFCHCAMCILLD